MVVVSSGFHKTHITTAAREAYDRGLLTRFLVGAYPTDRLKRVLHLLRLSDRGRIGRLIERDEAIPRESMRVLWFPELLYEGVAAVTRPEILNRRYEPAAVRTFGAYGRLAGRELHRAGAGGARVPLPRRLRSVIDPAGPGARDARDLRSRDRPPRGDG